MEQSLIEAAIMTFEEMGFVFVEPADEEFCLDEVNDPRVSVSFLGPINGRVGLQVEPTILSAIAMNMFGDESLTDEIKTDILGELANIICGNALPLIAGRTEVFRLSAPRSNGSANLEGELAAVARLTAAEGRAEVSLFVTH